MENIHINSKNVSLPPFSLSSGGMARLMCRKLSSYLALQRTFVRSPIENFIQIEHWGTKRMKKNWFQFHTVKSFLEVNSPLDSREYMEILRDGGINPDIKINLLGKGQRNFVFLMAVQFPHHQLIVPTIAMYASLLIKTYGILSSILANGGQIIEITYPPFDDPELDSLLRVHPQIIHVDS